MSLFVENNELVDVSVYYKFKKIGTGKKIVIIEDKKAEKILEIKKLLEEEKKVEEIKEIFGQKDEEFKKLEEKEKDKKIQKLIDTSKEEIEKLITKWRTLNWKEQNEVSEIGVNINAQTGQRTFNIIAYRDAIIKRCLKEWDIRGENNQILPVSSVLIDKLPGPIMMTLYNKFEEMMDYTEQDLKN